MTITNNQQKIILAALIATIVLFNGYRFLFGEKPKTAPLVYERGAVASSPVRHGLESRTGGDPLSVFVERSVERYPGVSRDIFRMENPVAKPKAKPAPAVVVVAPPPVPERSAADIAADLARADLSKFQFLGYLTDKDSTLFLSKDGELFMVKKGDKLLKSYQVKDARKEFVLLLDTATGVEVRVDFPGGAPATQPPAQAQPAPQQRPQQAPFPQRNQPPQSVQQPSGPQPSPTLPGRGRQRFLNPD